MNSIVWFNWVNPQAFRPNERNGRCREPMIIVTRIINRAFTTIAYFFPILVFLLGIAKMSVPDWLEDCIQVANEHPEHPGERRNVLNFIAKPNAEPTNEHGQSALDLVYQAAELVNRMQEEARQREARAQDLCRTAVERLQLAEKRATVAEGARSVAEGARSVAEQRLSATEAKLAAAELRAKNAEATAKELDRALSKIEDAIRTKLLGETGADLYRRGAAA